MEILTDKELLKLGTKYQKWFENTMIDPHPYIINGSRYYLSYYFRKLNMTNEKACAVVSPDSNNKDEALQALKPLVFFTVSLGNLSKGTKFRAELDYSLWIEVRDYLKDILDANVLDGNLLIPYQRSYEILQNMIDLQTEMVGQGRKYDDIYHRVTNRGYFVDNEIDEVLQLIPTSGWIQYAQFKDRYEYREDFDVIYENRNLPSLKPFHQFKRPKVLYFMTSKVAERELKESRDRMTDGIDMSHLTREEYISHWKETYTERLHKRVDELSNKLRYP